MTVGLVMPAIDTPAARRKREEEQRERQRQEQPKAASGQAASGAAPLPEIRPIDFSAIPDTEPPPWRFIVDQWLPAGCLSSCYGPGGVGKSLLAQQLATCIVSNREFLGVKVEQCPVIGLFGEDDDGEPIRRQWRINRALGINNRELVDLYIQGRAGLDNCLASFPMGSPRVEPLFEAIISKTREYGAGAVMLDNRSQMLLVQENDRAQATFAANLCAGISREANDAAALLLGHVAKAENSEYSGSTAWDAVTRSRWWLRRMETDDKDAPPELLFERVKSNYAQPDTMRLAWSRGVLQPVDEKHMTSADILELKLRQGAACQVFLDLLDQLTAQGRPVSHSNRAPNYAPAIMAAMVDNFSKRDLERAMERLFADVRIKANASVVKGADRKWKTGIARTAAAGGWDDA